MGRLLWNSKGVAGNPVKLCEDITFIGGCKGREYDTLTDETGVYLFTDLPPREYALATKALDSPDWLYVTVGLGLQSGKYTVVADQTLVVGDLAIFKTDLKILFPAETEKVSDPKPTLRWEAYPQAAFYSVSVYPQYGSVVFYQQRVDTNELSVPNALLTCEYTWTVDAFNSDGMRLAKNAGSARFYIVGQPASCLVKLISPADKATVSAKGLTLSWEPNPLADRYKVFLNRAEGDYASILTGVETAETSYTLEVTLQPGKYTWTVSAYDEFGSLLASSNASDLVLTSP
jgi:hypothetical protein